MKTKIFLFQEQPGKTVDRTVDTLRFVFHDCLNNSDSVKCFPGVKNASESIKQAFADSHLILFLAETKHYSEIKRKISKSLKLSMEVNEELQSRAFRTLNKIIPNASSEEYAHCVVPVNSRIFALKDGLFSGYSVSAGNQTIVFIPYETGRTELLLCNQVIPYINSLYNVQIDKNAFRAYNCNRLEKALESCSYDLGLTFTNTSPYFCDYISGFNSITDRIKVSTHKDKRGRVAPEDYIVNQSIMVKELMNASFGLSISNAYYSGNDAESEKIIYLAITNDKKTSLREVHSFPEETIEDFLERASGDLCIFTADVLETENSTEEYITKSKRKVIKNYKIGISITVVLIAAVAALIVYFFSKNNYSAKNWVDGFVSLVLPGTQVEETLDNGENESELLSSTQQVE